MVLRISKVNPKSKISSKLDLYGLSGLRLKAFWTIDHLTSPQKDRFSAAEVAKFLVEEMGINASRQAVRLALIRDNKYCNKNKKGFKLMKAARDVLSNQAGREEVIFIESGKPFSAKNLTIQEIFGDLKGFVRICDPYVDSATLDIIVKNIDKKIPVTILTSKVIDKPKGAFSRQLSDLKHEGYDVEVKIYSNSILHDRYFIDDESFWLSGNSLNHLGKKESFVVRLKEDVRQAMLATFNRRWKVGISV